MKNETDRKFAEELKAQFFDGLRQIDLYPDNDTCCRILAWLLVYGGGCEDTVFNKRFNADIMAAQKRLNIYGGEPLNTELLPVLQECIASLADYYNPPDWVSALENKYGLASINRKKLFGGEK